MSNHNTRTSEDQARPQRQNTRKPSPQSKTGVSNHNIRTTSASEVSNHKTRTPEDQAPNMKSEPPTLEHSKTDPPIPEHPKTNIPTPAHLKTKSQTPWHTRPIPQHHGARGQACNTMAHQANPPHENTQRPTRDHQKTKEP